MNELMPDDPIQIEDESSQAAVDDEPQARPPSKLKRGFSFWQGIQTALGAAFIVATLFTLWTPGSLVDSQLEAGFGLAALDTLAADELDDEIAMDQWGPEIMNRIGIVAGHYENDPGAVCPNGVTEAELNLQIASLVQKSLTDLGYQVDLLEEFDQQLWGYQAAVVVSIHLDSCQYINDQATGYKVAAALASRDANASQRLTACLSNRYGEVTGLPYHAGSVTDDMTYYHAFNEIDPGTMAAIIEAGFMNMDYQFITEESEIVAEGIVAGILCYLNNEPIQSAQTQ